MDPDVTQEGTLEETVYNYIKKWQGVENGKGVGITIDHLNRNIVHPNKKVGKDSRKKFYTLLREMKSLHESEVLWDGHVVFQLKEQQSELQQAKNSRSAVANDMQKRLNVQLNQQQPEPYQTKHLRSAVAYGRQIWSNGQHNEPQSELQQAKNLLFVIVNEMENHMKALSSSHDRVNICRDEFAKLVRDLEAARKLL